MRWIAVLGVTATLCGCFDSNLTLCENGAICPQTLVCTERDDVTCGTELEVAACRGIADRTACSTTAFPIGTCQSGVCIDCVPEKLECRYHEWRQMQSPTAQLLNTLWTVADNDVYVGGAGPVVLHYDGAAWSMLTPPSTGVAVNAIWASAGGDVVAVFADGNVFRRRGGDVWDMITPPSPPPLPALFGIWGSAIDELFVAGEAGKVFRYDGTMWSPIATGVTRPLNAIWGTSPTHLVAAGGSSTVIVYDGANWSAPQPSLSGYTFNGAWTSATRLVAAGYMLPSLAGMTAMRDADMWKTDAAPAVLRGVWGRADDDIYAVGDDGAITRFDGTAWMSMTSNTPNALKAVGGTNANVFVVGDKGTILRYSPN